MRPKNIYKKSITHFGQDIQLIMLMEECAELIQATSKVLRQQKIEGAELRLNNFAEEIADVEIMIGQARKMFDWNLLEDKIEAHKTRKLERLEKLVSKK